MAGQESQNELLKKKFRGRTEIPSKYIPKFPVAAERDYTRMMNVMVREVLKSSLTDYLPEAIQIINQAETKAPWGNQKPTQRLDARETQGEQAKKNQKERAKYRMAIIAQVTAELDGWFERLKGALESRMKIFRVRDRLNTVANVNRKLTVKEWKKVIGKTLGINILEDYYDGEYFREALEKWVNENVDLIVIIPNDMLDDMKRVILESYLNGDTVTSITKKIERCYGVTKSHARLIASDQMGKLSSQLSRYQQTKAGVSKYVWRTAGDNRVRETHKALDRKTFSWDNPPVVDKKGRRCHPGEDYHCRCIAVPVLDLGKLEIPADGRMEQKAKIPTRQKQR